MSTDGHMVCESRDRELEPIECVPQVGNSSPSGVELGAEFWTDWKNSDTSRCFADFGKVRTWVGLSIFRRLQRGLSS